MAGIPVTLQVVTKYLTEATQGREVALDHGLRVKTIGQQKHFAVQKQREMNTGNLVTLSFFIQPMKWHHPSHSHGLPLPNA